MRVAKWGNSLAVRIPASLAETLNLREGDEVNLVAGEQATLTLERKPSAIELLERLKKYRGRMPEDFKFDREEANSRD